MTLTTHPLGSAGQSTRAGVLSQCGPPSSPPHETPEITINNGRGAIFTAVQENHDDELYLNYCGYSGDSMNMKYQDISIETHTNTHKIDNDSFSNPPGK